MKLPGEAEQYRLHMARKIVLLLIVLTGAGLGLIWYLGVDLPPSEEPSRRVLAEIAEPATVAGATAPLIPAMTSSPVLPSNHLSVATTSAERDPLSEPRQVGLPFELSGSVRINCQRFASDCRELNLFLKRMAAEPRSADWAGAMEARIEKAVLSGERGKFRIRALECRSTRCALEVASEVDRIGVAFDSDPDFDEIMFPRPGYFADEDDPQTGTTTLVSAQVWQTWESFNAEETASE